jgi:hypothetical protein
VPVLIRGFWTMQCPQCGAETPDEEWNCVSCRINVYWASQHYADLAAIRQRQGLAVPADTPPFLRQVHMAAMGERADRGGKVEHRVRQIARRVMSGGAPGRAASQASRPAQSPADPSSVAESGWKQPDIESSHFTDSPPRQPMEAT